VNPRDCVRYSNLLADAILFSFEPIRAVVRSEGTEEIRRKKRDVTKGVELSDELFDLASVSHGDIGITSKAFFIAESVAVVFRGKSPGS
jgi:hypothetical protein